MNKPLYQPDCECPCAPSSKSSAPGPYPSFTPDLGAKLFELGAKCAEDEFGEQLEEINARVTKLEEAAAKPFRLGDRLLQNSTKCTFAYYDGVDKKLAHVKFDGEKDTRRVFIDSLSRDPDFKSGDRIRHTSGREGVIDTESGSSVVGVLFDNDRFPTTINKIALTKLPPKPEPKFEVGDEVLITGDTVTGIVMRVFYVGNHHNYKVRFSDGSASNQCESNLSLAPQPQFKIGDLVQLLNPDYPMIGEVKGVSHLIEVQWPDNRTSAFYNASQLRQAFKVGDKVIAEFSKRIGTIRTIGVIGPGTADVKFPDASPPGVALANLEHYVEPKPEPKFKAGDRVIGVYSKRHGVVRCSRNSFARPEYVVDWDNGQETLNATDTDLSPEPVAPKFKLNDELIHSGSGQLCTFVGYKKTPGLAWVRYGQEIAATTVLVELLSPAPSPKPFDLDAALKELEKHKFKLASDEFSRRFNDGITFCITRLRERSFK